MLKTLNTILIVCLITGISIASANQGTAPMTVSPETARPAGMPARGSTMDQVKKAYGPPLQIIGPSGEVTKTHPPITRWVYKDYIVYFENDRVIHSARPRSLDIIKFLDDSPLPPPAQPARKSH